MDLNELRIGIGYSVACVFWSSGVCFLNEALAAEAIVAVKTEVVKLLVVLCAAVSFWLF